MDSSGSGLKYSQLELDHHNFDQAASVWAHYLHYAPEPINDPFYDLSHPLLISLRHQRSTH